MDMGHIPDAYRTTLSEARSLCPYFLDRTMRSLPEVPALPPGDEDLWAHRAAKASVWEQGKHHAHEAVVHKGILPRGLPPSDHALCAASYPSPYQKGDGVADDLDFALRMVIEKGPDIVDWRAQQFQRLQAFGKALLPARAALEDERGFTSKRVSKHVRLERVMLASYAAGWPDTKLHEMVRDGATIAGRLPHSGIYRQADVQAAISLDDLQVTSEAWIAEILSRAPPKEEQLQAVWEKSREEVELGLLRGHWSKDQMDRRWGLGRWRPLVRFAIWQALAKKWRCIDNGRSASTNYTLETDERIHTTSVQTGAATIRRLRHHLGRRLSGAYLPRSSTQDMKRAFRQLGVRDRDRCMHIVAIFHPTLRAWVFFELDGLAFGLGAAVLEFNRVPAQLVALARRWLAIPAVNFYDDFRITDICGTGGNANYMFEALCSWIGWWLDIKKHQPPAASIVFLGTLEDASHVEDEDEVRIQTTEERRLLILEELRDARTQAFCPPSQAAHIVGKLIHVAEALPGRSGRGQLNALTAHAAGDVGHLTMEALTAIDFHLSQLSIPRYRAVPLSADAFPTRAVISDASWNDLGHENLHGRVCFIVFGQKPSERFGGVLDIPYGSELVSNFEERRSQIMAAEILGPMLAMAFANNMLAGCTVNFFIDNLSGLCALVKGGSRRVDLAGLAYGVWHGLGAFDMRAWFDYVESESNLADGGSRVGPVDVLARRMGVRLAPLPSFSLPKGFPRATTDQWSDWWCAARHNADEFMANFR